jgi:hypothetical protein
LWAFLEHPIDSVTEFSNECYEIGQYVWESCKNLEQDKIVDITDELKTLYEKYEQLSDAEKGHLIGYTIGKYGVDIFAGGATLKCIKSYKKLKEVSRIYTLEALTLEKNKLITSSINHASQRETYVRNIKIHWDKQNKHIPGTHNFESTRSILEHPEPQKLLSEFGGKGYKVKGEFGNPGYNEVVDFKENIGLWKSVDGTQILQTTKGSIRYAKDGAHIIPIHPESKIFNSLQGLEK